MKSAGLLLHRSRPTGREVLLVHPGGPLWARRDEGAWSIPKGELRTGEDPLGCATREFAEELGVPAPPGPFDPLGEVRQAGGKVVEAWAVEADLEVGTPAANLCTMQWPPRSGRYVEFPEIDRAEWFSLDEARRRINPGQAPLLDRLRDVAPA